MSPTPLSDIQLLLMDVDGVLTNGSILYSDEGTEIKRFNVKDGLGIKLLSRFGIQTGIITGRKSHALQRRVDELGISIFYEGIRNKIPVLEEIIRDTGVPYQNTAYVGDDLPDLPLIQRVGVGISVADGHESLKRHADLVTVQKGGNGAVREVCDKILQAKGHWESLIRSYQ